MANADRKRLKAVALALTILVTNSALGQQTFSTGEAAQNGWATEHNRSAAWHRAQHVKLGTAIAGLKPQRPGMVDAYVVTIGLDSDPVFGREAGEAAKVLSRRYNAAGRTVFLTAGSDDKTSGVPQGSPPHLATALAAIAAKMDMSEDVLVLFVTTHGDPVSGLVYHDGANGVGMITPQRLASLLDGLKIKRRMILLSACYAGVFIPMLSNKDSIVITAASSDRSSFGCAPGNDWTFFGDALINNAMRKPQPLDKASDEAVALIRTRESALNLVSSKPQVHIGENTKIWLTPLEARMPKAATPKVGRPAVESD